MRSLLAIIVFSGGVLTGCGGGGSSSNNGGGGTTPPPSPQVADGRFIDSTVEGLAYSSGDLTGITDSSGTFSYEVGQNVTLSVGAVTLGASTGNSIITPVDLLAGNSSDVDIQNLVRFLLMLDADNDGSNGIMVSNAVQLMAVNWSQVDFTTSDLDGELVQIIADVAAVDNRVPALPDGITAQSHIEGTLACLSSGVFSGTFTGADDGTFLLWVQHQRFDPLVFGDNEPRTGVTSALVYSTAENVVSGVAPQQGLSFDSDKSFISGLVSSGAEFSGELVDYNSISNGSWVNTIFNESGTFSGERIAEDSTAIYRLSGFFNLLGFDFTADDTGVVALNIFADNSVSGVMVTLRGQETVLTGTLDGDIITVTGGGNTIDLSFDPDGTDSSNDASLGDTSGFLGQYNSASGLIDIIGTSCKLN